MRSPLRTLAIAVPACLIAAAVAATPATAAAPLKVTNGNDAGAGSLRQALDTASAAGGGTVVISKGVQIALDSEVAYSGSGPLILQGGGATVSAGGSGAFHLVRTTGGGALTIKDLTITGAAGAGLVVEVPAAATADQVLRLQQVTVSANGLNGIYVDDCATTLEAGNPAQCDDAGAGSAAGVVLDISGTTISNNGFRDAQKDFDGIRVNERGEGSIMASISGSSVLANAADGIELDEDSGGGVSLTVRGGSFSDNGAQPQDITDPEDAIDIDERGEGSVATDVADVTSTGNYDENLDFNESDAGDLNSRLVSSTVTGALGGRGYDLEELGEGNVTATVNQATISGNDSDGMRANEDAAGDLSLTVTGSTFSDNGSDGIDLKQVSPGTGAAIVRDSVFSGNAGKGIKKSGVTVTEVNNTPAVNT